MKEEIVNVSSKGQIVLPSDIREELHIEKGRRMVVTIKDGVVVMKPLKKLSELKGVLAGTNKDLDKTIKELRKEWDVRL